MQGMIYKDEQSKVKKASAPTDILKKEKSIAQLEKEYDEYDKKCQEIRMEIKKKQMEGIDYTGKYIQYTGYKEGMMYVTWQKVDGDNVWLQGFAMDVIVTPYMDDTYVYSNAMEEWGIPVHSFLNDVKNYKIKEVDKETFLAYCKNGLTMYMNHCDKILESCINEVEDKEDEK